MIRVVHRALQHLVPDMAAEKTLCGLRLWPDRHWTRAMGAPEKMCAGCVKKLEK